MEKYYCPFCGSKSVKVHKKNGKIIYNRSVTVISASVRCNACHARGPAVSGERANNLFGDAVSNNLTTMDELVERAIMLWNTAKR